MFDVLELFDQAPDSTRQKLRSGDWNIAGMDAELRGRLEGLLVGIMMVSGLLEMPKPTADVAMDADYMSGRDPHDLDEELMRPISSLSIEGNTLI